MQLRNGTLQSFIRLLVRAVGHGQHADQLWDLWDRGERGQERCGFVPTRVVVADTTRTTFLVETAKEVEFSTWRSLAASDEQVSCLFPSRRMATVSTVNERI
jgi:hypothetical protein